MDKYLLDTSFIYAYIYICCKVSEAKLQHDLNLERVSFAAELPGYNMRTNVPQTCTAVQINPLVWKTANCKLLKAFVCELFAG